MPASRLAAFWLAEDGNQTLFSKGHGGADATEWTCPILYIHNSLTTRNSPKVIIFMSPASKTMENTVRCIPQEDTLWLGFSAAEQPAHGVRDYA